MAYIPVGVEVEVTITIVLVAVGELGLIITKLGLKVADVSSGKSEAERLTDMDEL